MFCCLYLTCIRFLHLFFFFVSVKELQFLCGRLDFAHIYSLKKLMFLHKLLRQNNVCLNVCFSVFRRSTEFLSLCEKFNLMIDQ